jgi:hypothetical protein
VVAAHDAEHGGEPEPAAGEFRGEERIENLRHRRSGVMPQPLSRTSRKT